MRRHKRFPLGTSVNRRFVTRISIPFPKGIYNIAYNLSSQAFFFLDISKKAVFLPPIPIGVPYLPTQIERQAEIKPFAPDTDNAETGNRVPHHSSIDLLNY